MAYDYVNRWNSIKAEAVVFQIFTTKLEQESEHCLVAPEVSFTRETLQKLMYFCDFNYYEATGRYLSRETYVRGRNGPIPIHFDMIMDELVTDERIDVPTNGEYRLHMNYPTINDDIQHECLTLEKDSDSLDDLAYHTLPKLNNKQKQIIDQVVTQYSDLDPSELESLCKQEGSWIVVSDDQKMDYDVVFYRGDNVARAE